MFLMDRDFKGVWIPADLWLDTSISPIQKFFLLEIDSFNTKEGCFASNKHFANLFGLSVGRCSEIISILVEKGLVEKRLIYEGKVVKKRTLKPVLGVLGKPKGGTRKIRRVLIPILLKTIKIGATLLKRFLNGPNLTTLNYL